MDELRTGSSPTFAPRKLDDRISRPIMRFITFVTFSTFYVRLPRTASGLPRDLLGPPRDFLGTRQLARPPRGVLGLTSVP